MSILDAFNRNYQSYTDQVYGPGGYYTNSPSRMDYNIDANKAATELISNTLQQGLGSFGTPAAAMAELAAPAIAFGASPFHDIAQAAQRARKSYNMPTGYGRMYDYMETPVGPTMSEFAKAISAEQIPSTMIQRAMGAAVPISNRIKTGLNLIGNFGFSPATVNDFGVTSDFGYPSTPSVSKTTNIDTSFGVANEEDEEQVDYLGGQPKSFRDSATLQEYFQNRNPITGIMNLFRNVPTPFKLGLNAFREISSALQNTDFGRSKTLAEYFDRKSRIKNAKRMAEKYKEFGERDPADRGKGLESAGVSGGVYGGGAGGLHSYK